MVACNGGREYIQLFLGSFDWCNGKQTYVTGIRKIDGAKESEFSNGQIIIQLEIRDYIWIAFSFIIAILIFSSFSTQIQLTTNIVANISLAFGFGFGFDKVLEVAKRFQNIASS
ncbi:MAG TPA: hypothetical protein VE378_03310 [Nitrososphaeraceae archaeon]|nr:hypothetical protein [Nitrososphaeraceae archaeon]